MSNEPEVKDSAREVLRIIAHAFGLDPINPEESIMLPLIAEGRILFDSNKEAVEYVLSSPIELKNGEKVTYIALREPTGPDLEYIRAETNITIKSSGDTIEKMTNAGSIVSTTIRAVAKSSDQSLAVAQRLKRRDIDTLSGVLAELGFFG